MLKHSRLLRARVKLSRITLEAFGYVAISWRSYQSVKRNARGILVHGNIVEFCVFVVSVAKFVENTKVFQRRKLFGVC